MINQATTPRFDMGRLTLGADISAGDYEISFVVDKLIPEHAVTLFYAKGGSGKSTLATQLAASVVTGKPFMGLNVNTRPVVVVDYENPLAVLKERIDAVEDAKEVYFWTSNGDPPQLNKGVDDLMHLVQILQDPLIIIDTLSSSCSGLDILANGAFSPVMQKIIELRNLGATVVLLHHTPKQDETKYIGASVIYNQCDHILAMYPVKSAGTDKEALDEDEPKIYRIGTKDKTRFVHFSMHIEFDEDAGVFKLAADPDALVIEEILQVIESRGSANQTTIVQHVGTRVSRNKLMRLLKQNEGRLWQVERAEKNAKIYRPIQFSSSQQLYSRETEKQDSQEGVSQ